MRGNDMRVVPRARNPQSFRNTTNGKKNGLLILDKINVYERKIIVIKKE